MRHHHRSTRFVSRALCAALVAAHAHFAAAFQPLITDDTGTQGAGGNQLELAFDREEFKSEGVKTTTRSFPLTYTRGLTDTLDVYAGASHVRIDSDDPGAEARGHGNPTLGVKWRFHDDASERLSIALKPEVRFGSSSTDERRGVSIGRNSYSGLLLVTQETSFGSVLANYGYTRVNYALESNRSQQRSSLHRLSVAPVIEAGPMWKLALDAGIVTNPLRRERVWMGYVEAGAIWSPTKDVDVALGWIRPVRDGEPHAAALTAGLTWRFR
jgi:hypothetical protein